MSAILDKPVDSSTWTNADNESYETKRKLASVQVIKSLEPIEGADKIELAKVLGWEIVVAKGLHNVGDKIVYIEVDSIVPLDNPEFEFLKARGGSNPGRIKTIKLRGQVSQGLIVPLSVLPSKNKWPILRWFIPWEVDDDVTETLGITKYDPETQEERAKLGRVSFKVINPEFLLKHDE